MPREGQRNSVTPSQGTGGKSAKRQIVRRRIPDRPTDRTDRDYRLHLPLHLHLHVVWPARVSDIRTPLGPGRRGGHCAPSRARMVVPAPVPACGETIQILACHHAEHAQDGAESRSTRRPVRQSKLLHAQPHMRCRSSALHSLVRPVKCRFPLSEVKAK